MADPAPNADTFDAIADPQRRHILEMLAQGELTVTEITARLAILQPAASKQSAHTRARMLTRGSSFLSALA